MIRQLFTFILLILVCVATSFAVVFPLWKYASICPKLYSATVFCIIVFFVLAKLTKLFIKCGAKVFFTRTIKICLLCTAFILPIYFILQEHRLFALLAFVGTLVLYGTVNVAFSKKN